MFVYCSLCAACFHNKIHKSSRGMDVLHIHPTSQERWSWTVCIFTEQFLSSHMQARSLFGSYWKGSEWRLKQKLQMNRRDSDKEGGQETKSRISEYWCTRHASTNNHSMCFEDFKKAFNSISRDRLWMTMMDMGYPLHLIYLLAKLYRKQLAKVQIAGTLSKWFHVKKGVR